MRHSGVGGVILLASKQAIHAHFSISVVMPLLRLPGRTPTQDQWGHGLLAELGRCHWTSQVQAVPGRPPRRHFKVSDIHPLSFQPHGLSSWPCHLVLACPSTELQLRACLLWGPPFLPALCCRTQGPCTLSSSCFCSGLWVRFGHLGGWTEVGTASYLGLSKQNTTNWVTQNNRNAFSPSSGH